MSKEVEKNIIEVKVEEKEVKKTSVREKISKLSNKIKDNRGRIGLVCGGVIMLGVTHLLNNANETEEEKKEFYLIDNEMKWHPVSLETELETETDTEDVETSETEEEKD